MQNYVSRAGTPTIAGEASPSSCRLSRPLQQGTEPAIAQRTENRSPARRRGGEAFSIASAGYEGARQECSFKAFTRTVRYGCRGSRIRRKCKTRMEWTDNFQSSKLRAAVRETNRRGVITVSIGSTKIWKTTCRVGVGRARRSRSCWRMKFNIYF